MEVLETNFISDHLAVPLGRAPEELLVSDVANMDLEDWATVVKEVAPRTVIAPWNVSKPGWSSRCADRARAEANVPVGVVVCGTSDSNRVEYFMWAQEHKYFPICLLPHVHKNRTRQMLELAVPKYVRPGSWVHFPGRVEEDFDESIFPGIHFSKGREFIRWE
jgi:hypothetical protein